jgi:hypothetical protein
VRTSIARKFLLIAMAPILACALPLSTIHGVVNRQEEIWIKVGSNEAGLWAMDVATLQTRDLYRWVWLRSYHHQYGEPDRLHDATWRYVFIDCHDQRARFEQFKRMIHDGRLFEGLEGNEAGINELKPYPPQSIIGSVVSDLCSEDGLRNALQAKEVARAINDRDPAKADAARAALESRHIVVLEQ